MLLEEHECTEAREIVRNNSETAFVSDRRAEFWIHVLGLTAVVAITHFFSSNLSVPLVLVWLGVAINSKLVAIYYAIRKFGDIQSCYYEESRCIAREILDGVKNRSHYDGQTWTDPRGD
jgi:hypothetical protein